MFLASASTVFSAQQFHPDSLHRGHVSLFVKTIARHNFILLQVAQQPMKHLSSFGVGLEYRENPVLLVLFDQTLVCCGSPEATLSSGEPSCSSASCKKSSE